VNPITAFPGCGLRNDLLVTVAQIGFRTPTNVQRYSIPYILSGSDLIVTAQTGSGKTAAYMLPIISFLAGAQRDPSAIVLVPTRELALQIEQEVHRFTAGTALRVVSVFGGAPGSEQIRQLHRGADIIIATPGRLQDFLDRGHVRLWNVAVLVLDEADRMLDMGFEPQISQVINGYDMPVPGERQTLLFSATFPPEIRDLAQRFMRDGVTRIEVGAQEAPAVIEQRFVHAPEGTKPTALLDAIGSVDGQTLVFAERKSTVDAIEDFLEAEQYRVVAIHGDRDWQMRLAALRGFKNGRADIMVATDVAARGLDIPTVAHVINVDLPGDVDTYIHRIGRTGRAGRHGVATSLWNEHNIEFLLQLCANFRRNRQTIPQELGELERLQTPQNGRSRGPLRKSATGERPVRSRSVKFYG
jgi:ATP-dependent RNA helicase DDX3X